MTVRTRVAPSPTGDPHVGTAYIALFNMCFARAHGGQFLLRIEDTDQTRSTPESEQAILDSLRWLGLEWDEGPDVGGDNGPYRQSERMEIYGQYAHQLVDDGKAFICYRTADELNELREAKRESGDVNALKPSDLMLPEDEVVRRRNAGEPHVIRMIVPEEEGACEVDDMLRGTIELDWSMIDAQILLKSDGMPTYHLANVVDDHLMGITHVLRGEEWINSAPKHKLLYEYFGWDMPQLCHLPLLRNPDKSKLSKRKNPTSILYYQRMGFLPEALLNYLGRMGWSMPDESEKFSLQQMQDNFDIQRVSLGGPIFDVEKLSWLNGMWIREDLNEQQLAERLVAWAFNEENLLKVLPHAQKRMETLSDFAPLAAFLVSGTLPINEESFAGVKGEREDVVKGLQFALWKMEALQQWNRDNIWNELKAVADALGVKVKDFLAPIFVAIAGTSASFSVVDSMELIGPDMSRARLRQAIGVLGGVSKKGMKRLEKEYQTL
ncbi:glutamate--tRNA ligase [Halioglobus japonicus]|uniref:Glutamate--tRNA ligase n=1 Tax=Halioglobus japonicus TaxID=930805 RepID=A0AAP8SPN4_9GAMM|nr:glutamate--tRNA ligase [Halioglobus japonicus]AQA19116.1 glutamate--tRNA ligase [Halioglobus japonicus]PLW87857.1 glutamate--tRNA ligase [Halioglobus japonicus]GHD06198.1 glutamate--tRNA ligase [Halioglobus japonicus]